MNSQIVLLLAHSLIILGALLSIIYTLGVVWRVGKKLDTAYKLFFASMLSFTISETASLFAVSDKLWISYAVIIFRLIFVVFFLFGILEMRTILRRIDEEKPTKSLD
jgi:hypothetical protein